MQSENTLPGRKINGTFQRTDLHPDPLLAAQNLSITIVHRFFEKVEKTDTCWYWNGAETNTGPVLGRGSFGSGNISARILSWLIHCGPLQEGRLKPICGRSNCVNPQHLRYGKKFCTPILNVHRLEMLLSTKAEVINPSVQDPALPDGFTITFRERFWSKVQITDDCYIWLAGRNNHGYGCIGKGANGKGNVIGAHIASFILHGGVIPDGFLVRHICPNGPNKLCVRPDHLCLGTQKDNSSDAAKLLRESGKAHWNAKLLTIAKVIEIRQLAAIGISNIELGHKFGVNPHYISKIVHGHAWNRPGCLADRIPPGITGQDLDFQI